MRPTGDAAEPFVGGRALRPLRVAAPPVRALPRRRGPVRSLLWVLRIRDGAGGEAPALVAPVVPGRAATRCAWSRVRNRAGAGALTPSSQLLPTCEEVSAKPTEGLSVQPLTALHAVAVPSQIVVAA